MVTDFTDDARARVAAAVHQLSNQLQAGSITNAAVREAIAHLRQLARELR